MQTAVHDGADSMETERTRRAEHATFEQFMRKTMTESSVPLADRVHIDVWIPPKGLALSEADCARMHGRYTLRLDSALAAEHKDSNGHALQNGRPLVNTGVCDIIRAGQTVVCDRACWSSMLTPQDMQGYGVSSQYDRMAELRCCLRLVCTLRGVDPSTWLDQNRIHRMDTAANTGADHHLSGEGAVHTLLSNLRMDAQGPDLSDSELAHLERCVHLAVHDSSFDLDPSDPACVDTAKGSTRRNQSAEVAALASDLRRVWSHIRPVVTPLTRRLLGFAILPFIGFVRDACWAGVPLQSDTAASRHAGANTELVWNLVQGSQPACRLIATRVLLPGTELRCLSNTSLAVWAHPASDCVPEHVVRPMRCNGSLPGWTRFHPDFCAGQSTGVRLQVCVCQLCSFREQLFVCKSAFSSKPPSQDDDACHEMPLSNEPAQGRLSPETKEDVDANDPSDDSEKQIVPMASTEDDALVRVLCRFQACRTRVTSAYNESLSDREAMLLYEEVAGQRRLTAWHVSKEVLERAHLLTPACLDHCLHFFIYSPAPSIAKAGSPLFGLQWAWAACVLIAEFRERQPHVMYKFFQNMVVEGQLLDASACMHQCFGEAYFCLMQYFHVMSPIQWLDEIRTVSQRAYHTAQTVTDMLMTHQANAHQGWLLDNFENEMQTDAGRYMRSSGTRGVADRAHLHGRDDAKRAYPDAIRLGWTLVVCDDVGPVYIHTPRVDAQSHSSDKAHERGTAWGASSFSHVQMRRDGDGDGHLDVDKDTGKERGDVKRRRLNGGPRSAWERLDEGASVVAPADQSTCSRRVILFFGTPVDGEREAVLAFVELDGSAAETQALNDAPPVARSSSHALVFATFVQNTPHVNTLLRDEALLEACQRASHYTRTVFGARCVIEWSVRVWRPLCDLQARVLCHLGSEILTDSLLPAVSCSSTREVGVATSLVRICARLQSAGAVVLTPSYPGMPLLDWGLSVSDLSRQRACDAARRGEAVVAGSATVPTRSHTFLVHTHGRFSDRSGVTDAEPHKCTALHTVFFADDLQTSVGFHTDILLTEQLALARVAVGISPEYWNRLLVHPTAHDTPCKGGTSALLPMPTPTPKHEDQNVAMQDHADEDGDEQMQ
jgi:hypothetical protein